MKLIGDAGTTYFARSTQLTSGLADWTTTSNYGQEPTLGLWADIANGYFTPFPINYEVLQFETAQTPDSGGLYFECYARAFHSFGQNDPTSGTEISSSSTDAAKLYIYSAPENSNHQEIQTYVNNSSTSKQVFSSAQNIANGETYDVGELFIGSGPKLSSCWSFIQL